MPTIPPTIVTTNATVTGGGGDDGAQWGSCPPGSLMDPQATSVNVASPSETLPSTCESEDVCGRAPMETSVSAGAGGSIGGGESLGGPATVNSANGNGVFRLAVPDNGLVSPSASLWYNGKDTNSDEFGYGWGNALGGGSKSPAARRPTWSRATARCCTIRADGMTGEYTPPAGATSKLKKVNELSAHLDRDPSGRFPVRLRFLGRPGADAKRGRRPLDAHLYRLAAAAGERAGSGRRAHDVHL